MHTQELALNGYGTIHDNLLLPATAVQGQYRVHLHRRSKTEPADGIPELSFETTFDVAEFKLEPVQISVDLPKEVYFRGEQVTGKIALKYYYGLALSGEEVHYRFGPDGETRTAKTNDDGEIEFSFETKQFSESQPLTLAVNYPARGMQSAKTVYLATRGFEIAVSTLRDVYISGESFDAEFKVTSPAGTPVEAELKVEVFEQTRLANGRPGEKLISSHDVSADAESASALQNLALEEAGRYIVRATATDQFGNAVSGETAVDISGDKDSVRLRILADTHRYDVGDDATIRVHWREQPALALITYEGASILGHQLVRLETGENEISVPMGSHLAPNFNLSVAVMHQNEFHSAESQFLVARKLNVQLALDANELKPGDPLTVGIVVTDPQGRPVQAEVALSLVQANLLEMFSERQSAIAAFFNQGERTPSVRQFSSCTFEYRPKTHGISRYLLAESERIEVLKKELEAAIALNERYQNEVDSRQWATLHDVEVDAVDGGVIAGDASGLSWRMVLQGRESEIRALEELSEALGDGDVDGLVYDDVISNFDSLNRGLKQQLSEESIPALSRLRRHTTRNSPEMAGQYAGGGLSAEFESGAADSPARASRRAAPSNGHLFSFDRWGGFGGAGGGEAMGRGALTLGRSASGAIVLSDGTESPVLGVDAAALPRSFFAQRDVTVNAVTVGGRLLALNGRDQDEIEQLVDAGVKLLPGMGAR